MMLGFERKCYYMKYIGMPLGMWMLFVRSFRRQLMNTLQFDSTQADAVTAAAKQCYREIVQHLPDFEKDDMFQMNIVSCAMLSAFYLNMPKKPDVDQMTAYYENAMMIPAVKWFCRQSGKRKFTEKDMISMKKTAALKAADRNPYSWNMEFYPYADGSGYEARLTKCGICTLMTEIGIPEVIPAMCHLDYAMSRAGNASEFVRQYTLGSGGPYCDCGYKKKREADCCQFLKGEVRES